MHALNPILYYPSASTDVARCIEFLRPFAERSADSMLEMSSVGIMVLEAELS